MPNPRIFNLGSVNIDHVYQVPHFVRPGETLASLSVETHAGGKGYNQSWALARAGARVHHVGAIGPDGESLREGLRSVGVETSALKSVQEPTGHAIIQISAEGENSILIHAGANRSLTTEDVETAMTEAGPGDWFLAQNETSAVPESLLLAKRAGLRLALNPAPLTTEVSRWPLDVLDVLIVNQAEGQSLASASEPERILSLLRQRYPGLLIILTLGSSGVIYAGPNDTGSLPAIPVQAIDTTAAGDTFLGFFLAQFSMGCEVRDALSLATKAAAIAVTRAGAAASIPSLEEVKRGTP